MNTLQYKKSFNIQIVRYIVFVLIAGFFTHQANAIEILRDAESENFLNQAVAPLFSAANVDKNSITILIANEKAINAFVTSGRIMVINAGLLCASSNSDVLYGVLAHETGHIANSHILRHSARDINSNLALSSLASLGGFLIGGPVGLLAGLTGLSTIYTDSLAYSRVYETEADNSAIKTLQASGRNLNGLYDVNEYFYQFIKNKNINPYLVTHPLSDERMMMISRSTAFSQGEFDTRRNLALEDQYLRVSAKMCNFLNMPQPIIKKNTTSIEKNLQNNLKFYQIYGSIFRDIEDKNIYQASNNLDNLLIQKPSDPYLLELKSDIHHLNGDIPNAAEYLRRAIKFLPYNQSYLIQAKLAFYLTLDTNDVNKITNANEAIDITNKIIQKEPDNLQFIQLNSKAYHIAENIAMSKLREAEIQLALSNYKDAQRLANEAQEIANNDNTGKNQINWSKVHDIFAICQQKI